MVPVSLPMMVRIALPTSVQKSLSDVVVMRLLSERCPVAVGAAALVVVVAGVPARHLRVVAA